MCGMSVTAAIARGLSSPAEVASPAKLSTGPERAGACIEFASRWGRGAEGPLHPSRARPERRARAWRELREDSGNDVILGLSKHAKELHRLGEKGWRVRSRCGSKKSCSARPKLIRN